MSSKRATLELVNVENAPPQEGTAFTTVLQQIARVFTNQYVDSSHEPCFGDFELDNNSEMCQTSQREE